MTEGELFERQQKVHPAAARTIRRTMLARRALYFAALLPAVMCASDGVSVESSSRRLGEANRLPAVFFLKKDVYRFGEASRLPAGFRFSLKHPFWDF